MLGHRLAARAYKPTCRNAHTPATPHPHTSRTARVGAVHPRCARVALLACPDAQRALLKPFLTSPPIMKTRGGEVRNAASTSGQASRAAGGNQPGKPFPFRPRVPAVWFPPAPPILSPLLARPGNPNYRQAPDTEEQAPGTGTPPMVGLRPPTATLRAAHHSTASRTAMGTSGAAHRNRSTARTSARPGHSRRRGSWHLAW